MEDDTKDTQIQVKKIPAFTVLKNGSILKNIFLLRKQNSSPNQEINDEILLVGRHPQCNITLEHPSISRYHLRIHSNPSLQLISVVDLSSVHGTWVSGKRIEPGIHVGLKEGDTVRMGGSSRVYELHWVPLSQAYDADGQFVFTIYTIKEGEEETNQDDKLETHSLEDDSESSDWSLSDNIHYAPLKTLNQVSSSELDYFSSSCDDTKLEQSNSSKTDNENGEICSTILVQPPLVVSGTISAIEDFNSLNESEDQLNLLGDNLSNEFELQNYGIVKEDSVSVPNCSKSSCVVTEVEHSSSLKKSHENDIIFPSVSVQAPAPPAVSRTISATDISESGLKRLEDQLNWLKDNLSNEFDLQSHGIIREDPFSVPNCSIFTCNDTEVEHWIPWKIGNKDGEIFTTVSVQDPLDSKCQLSWLKDNLTNDFELQNHKTSKDDLFFVPNCSKSSCGDTEVEHLSPQKTDNEDGEIFTTVSQASLVEHSSPCKTGNQDVEIFTGVSIQAPLVFSEAISETEISDSLTKSEDQSNWLKDNLSNEFEQLSHEAMKDDLVSVALFDAIKTQENNTLNQDILSNEYEQCRQEDVKEDHVSVDLFDAIKTHEKDALNQDISDNQEHSNWLRDNLSNEFEQFSHETMKDDLVSVDLLDSIKLQEKDGLSRDISVSLNKSEHWSNWLRDNLSNEYEQLSHGTMQHDLVSVNHFDAIKMHEKDVLNQDISRSNENEPVEQQEFDSGSLPVALFEAETRDEDKSFMPDRSGGKEGNVGCEFEQMTQRTDESSSEILSEVADSNVEDDVLYKSIISREEDVDLGVKFESINHETMKKESVFVVLSNETDMNQEQTLSPDISKAKEVHMNLFDSLDGKELELFTSDKENTNPNACSGKSLRKKLKEDELKQSNYCTMSQKAVSPTVNEEKDISDFSKISFTSEDEVDPFVHCEEALLSFSENESKSLQMKMEGSCSTIINSQTIEKVINSSHAKKRWTMIVDTSSLLHEESLKHLKLLQGLKGTQLFVPKIVITELMDIKSQDNFLKRRAKKVSLALKWIDECMANTKWWIHMDPESQVLETAICLSKEIISQKIIILSNDLTLKIKAMAEGIMCEAAEEFRRSLVNPYSEKFMWIGSSAIGLAWSSVDDYAVRGQKYHGCGSHDLKGLKLLAHV